MATDRLTQAQLVEYKECFDLFDKDRDGCITPADLGAVLRSLGQNLTESEVVSMQQEVGNSLVSWDLFLTLAGRRADQKENFDEILAAFKVFDATNSGYIPADELRHILTCIGEQLSHEEFDEIMKAANVPAGGKVRYNDFIRMLRDPAVDDR